MKTMAATVVVARFGRCGYMGRNFGVLLSAEWEEGILTVYIDRMEELGDVMYAAQSPDLDGLIGKKLNVTYENGALVSWNVALDQDVRIET